jgi:ubiquinone/menaquinone biosynthesis C-methylase UbiE
MYHFSIDMINRFREKNSMVPPQSMLFVGDGDFVQIGEQFKGNFIDLAGLQPNDRILDVGCGIGRMAVPLTDYLTPDGEYWGFDIVAEGIDWCNQHISSKYNNFHFFYCDIYNECYNSIRKKLAVDYQFPFRDDYFDFVFLTSVFTHMLPSAMENYLSEISRVLKTGATCFITFFLLNEESQSQIHAGNSTLDFRYEVDGSLTTNKDKPEAAVAYDEDFIERLYNKYALRISRPIHYGSWCKRNDYVSYQDIIVAKKIMPG